MPRPKAAAVRAAVVVAERVTAVLAKNHRRVSPLPVEKHRRMVERRPRLELLA